MKPKLVLLFSGLLMELTFLFYRIVPTGPAGSVLKYIIVYVVAFVILAAAYFLLKDRELTPSCLGIILAFSVLFGVTLLGAPPDQSDDIYRYLWDGKVQYHGVNPYKYAPQAAELAPYHSSMLPRLVNFTYIKTIYPPVAQGVFLLSYALFGESITGLKGLFYIFFLGSIYLFYKILQLNRSSLNVRPKGNWGSRGSLPLVLPAQEPPEGRRRRLLLFFAWNPLIVLETAVNGHLDVVMVFFVLGGLWFFLWGRFFWLGVFLGCAVLSKLIPVILVPVFFVYFLDLGKGGVGERPRLLSVLLSWEPWRRFFSFLGPMVLTVAVAYLPYYGAARNMFLTAVNYSTLWYFNNPLFHGFLVLMGDNTLAHVVSFSLFLLVYVLIQFHPRPLPVLGVERKIVYTVTAFVLFNPTIHPWYLILPVALLCIYRSVPVMWWSVLVVCSYGVVYRFKLTGVWRDSWWLMALEYVPLVLLLLLSRIISKAPPKKNA